MLGSRGMSDVAMLGRVVASVAADCPEVIGAYVFGSRERGDAHAGSDLDVGVLGRARLDLRTIVHLQDALEERLGMPVDVVDLSPAGAFLALDAVRGERVFERDPLALDEFDLYVLRRAGDLAFFERERRQALLRPPT
jgi:predicted nucleotidyltransferase